MYNKPYVNKMISKTQLAFTVEDIIDDNETDWKKTTIIKYNQTNTTIPKKIVPMHVLGCDMRYPIKENNEKEIAKIRTLYNKLQQIQVLESNNIGIFDKLQIIEKDSIIKIFNKKKESLDENDATLFEKIEQKFIRKGEITEMWWFYDW
jgi:hypothetical protein